MSEKEKNIKEEEEENQEEVLKELRKTRKAFLVEYGCAVFILGLLAVLNLKGISLKPIISKLAYSLAFLAVISAEGSRMMTKYKILPNKLSIIKGIIKHDKKNIYFHPLGFVPDLNIKQTRIQRVLGVGTIYLKGEHGHTFAIKDINNPHQILEMIEGLVQKNR
tara:strand:+ start:71 stop:562 length:492 start_codon:yes stop_codon:yes gene_type:complete